ncbi:four helix bundle protein [Aquimarina sp. U1-2]|uniref:four helix bundle protein n=1 Tax=Aquimarina sp. U1-2 TaxID=2823141 RepID=UPI001AED05D0|nr:four helix bundle protein [Aquimarina sp. U1-2]MBP2831580.1 four helix bundle protein [Aquimarina sp. U1-2]
MKTIQKYDLQQRLVKFSSSIILNINTLKKSFASEHLAKQLIRSTTSAALNYGEAQSAESKRDFIHKMKICLKELRESQVNLEILKESELIEDSKGFENIIQECKELVAIFTSSIKTTKVNNSNN